MRILCASWHYPPSSEICGKVAYRFARTLAARGHAITVVTVPPTAAVALDPAYGADVANVRVVRVAPWPDIVAGATRWTRRHWLSRRRRETDRPTNATPPAVTIRRHLRDLYEMPDRANGWIMPTRAALRQLVREEHPDLLLTHAPFFSAHVAGLGIRSSFPELPWWAWSHDPAAWNPFDLPMGTIRKRCLRRWEASVARGATGMCVATTAMAEEFRRLYQCEAVVLRSGYDPDDLPDAIDSPVAGPLILVHAGTLYGHRTPVPLLEAIAGLQRAGRLGGDDLRLRLIGDASYLVGETPRHAIDRLGLDAMVTLEPPVSQAAAFVAIAASHVGVVLAEGQSFQIPAKTFDYVGMHRPVLALADGETTALVERHGIGLAATRASLPGMLLALVAAFRADRLQQVTDRVIRAAPLFTMAAQAEVFERAVATAAVSHG